MKAKAGGKRGRERGKSEQIEQGEGKVKGNDNHTSSGPTESDSECRRTPVQARGPASDPPAAA